jgi:preprotein translocase subunit SecB
VLSQKAPDIKVEVDVFSAVLDKRAFEVMLALRIGATIDEKTAVLVELDYASIVQIGPSVPETAVEQLLFSETPRLLFPFARSLISKATGDGAFPPLFINPIDFESFYRTHKVGAMAAVMESAGAKPAAEIPAEATTSETA